VKTRLHCNNVEVPAGGFVSRFAANVSAAVVSSLDAPQPSRSIRFEFDGDNVALEVDGVPVPLDRSRGFAGTLVRSTLAGLVRELKGIEAGGAVRIAVELGDAE
jgi:hypothetical protein